MKPVGQAPKGSEHQGMNRLLNHIRGNVVAYLALFVALGGTGYAAINLPANSVGNRQIRNGAITPVKLDRQLVSGSVRAWAEVSATGRVLAGEGSPSVVVQKGQGSTGHYTVSWKVASLKRCVATGGVPATPNRTAPGFVTATTFAGPAAAGVVVYNAQGQQAALPFWVAVLC
jgi:hypothetical protein